jgi:MFS superfamily sulfate permease-like transporter
VLTFGAGLLAQIPLAALAGVLVYVALHLVRVRQMAAVLKGNPAEFALIVATAGAITLLPIERGVAMGVALSVLVGAWSSARARGVAMHRVAGGTVWWPMTARGDFESTPGVAVVGFQAPLTFLNAQNFRSSVAAAARAELGGAGGLLVLEAAGIIGVDYTGAQAFAGLVDDCKSMGVALAVARLESLEAQQAFVRYGLTNLIGAGRIFPTVAQAVDASKNKSA